MSDKEFLDSVIKKVSSDSSPEPISFPNITELNPSSPIFGGGTARFGNVKPEVSLGSLENFTNHFTHHNELFQLANFAIHTVGDYSSNDDYDPEYNPAQLENLIGMPETYWPYLLKSSSSKDYERRLDIAQEEIERNERLEAGGWLSGGLGAMAGIFLGPSTFIFPIGKIAKYASFSEHVIKGLGVVPRLSAQIAVNNALVESGQIKGNVKDWAINTVADIVFAGALVGVGRGVSYGLTNSKLWESRGFMKYASKGVVIQEKYNAAGEAEGFVASAAEGSGVGADVVSRAQRFIDEGADFNTFGGLVASIGKTPILGTPLIKGLTSSYVAVRSWYNKFGNSSYITGGITRGIKKSESALEKLTDITNEGRQVGSEIHDLFLDMLGMKPGIVSSAKALVKGFTDGTHINEIEFGLEISRVIASGKISKIKQVNEAATLQINFQNKHWKEFLVAHDYPPNILPPRNAIHYMSTHYNAAKMMTELGEESFEEVVGRALIKQDKEIRRIKAPMDALKARLDKFNKEQSQPGPRGRKDIQRDINRTQKQLTRLEKDLVEQMRNGDIDPALISERIFLTQTQHSELSEILKHSEKLKARIHASKAELGILSRQEQVGARKKIEVLEDNLEVELGRLGSLARKGKIDKNLFRTKDGLIEFLDVNKPPKFRDTYSDFDAAVEAGGAYKEKILGNTPEQLKQSILSTMSGGAMPDPTKGRTLLIPQIDLLNGGFISPDVSANINHYARAIGRRTASQNSFNEMGFEGGVEDLLADMSHQLADTLNGIKVKFNEDMEVAKLLKGSEGSKAVTKVTKEKDKEILAAHKEFKEAKDLFKGGYDRFMGNDVATGELARIAKVAKNYAAVTMLRNVPLLQVGDLATMVFKQRLWPVVRGLCIPFVKVVNKDISRDFKETYTHARVGLDLELNRYGSNLFDGGSGNLAGLTKFERGAEFASKAAPFVFGSAQIDNVLRSLSSNITQSRVMTDLFRAAEGKLSKSDANRLLINGIDPKDAHKYIAAYEKAEGYAHFGGHVSKWYNWTDPKLVKSMRRAINNDINGGVIQAGPFDKPFWTNKPIVGFPFQFMGYVYASYNRILMPLMQSPDGSKLAGVILAAGLGSFVEPMRAWEKGEEFKYDEEKTAIQHSISGILESGYFGFPVEFLQMMTSMLDVPYLNKLRGEKFYRRTPEGFWAGPVGGAAGNLTSIANSYLSGQITESTLMKTRNALPFPIPLYVDFGLTRWIKSWNLAKTTRETEKWLHRQEDK